MDQMDVNHMTGLAVVVAYISGGVLGFFALKSGAARTMYGAVIISTFACIMFAFLYPQYMAKGEWIDGDLYWAATHLAAALGVNLLHASQIKGPK